MSQTEGRSSAPAADPAAAGPPAPPAKAPVLWTNPITLFGLLNVACGLVLLLTFWLFETLTPSAEQNQYLNVVGFMILPGVLIGGLAMCPAGIVLRKRRLRRSLRVWHISTRQGLTFLGLTFFLILPLLGVSGYKGYHYTESAEFCGTVCHNMDPQYAGYERSPHARVTCAGCHIGPGATPFVKSKLSGIRQVFKTALDTFPRPVPPAITELRPARDTCEECHWPSQFFGSVLKKIPHYAPDEKNTLNTYEILVKVGGLNNHLGQAEGIHMHMLDRVEYVAEDHVLEQISWVRYKDADGTLVVYRSDGKPGADPPPAGGVTRRLDCIDCHNLIGHEFESPERAVDHALSVGRLDAALPFIKREAVRVLSKEYAAKPAALESIGRDLAAYYADKHPDLAKARPGAVEHAVEAVREIYRTQFFPEYKVDWRTYPKHTGHMESRGCFRCHDGLHVADDGRRITSDCTACHTFLYRKPTSAAMNALRAIAEEGPNAPFSASVPAGVMVERRFDHPMKIHDAWPGLGPHEDMLCSDCHDGGLGALGWRVGDATGSACGDCHPSGRWLEMKQAPRFRQTLTTRPVTAPSTP